MGTQRCWVAAKIRRTLRTKPWASGVAEVVTVGLMENVILKELIPLYVLLTRFFAIIVLLLLAVLLLVCKWQRILESTKGHSERHWNSRQPFGFR